MTTSTTATIASWVAGQHFDRLHPEAVRRAREMVLDTIGCALGGSAMEAGKIFLSFAKDLGGRAEATLAGDGTKVDVRLAAGVNAYLANRLDYDETSRNGHIASPIVHTALALGERLGASGRDVITAIATGYEVSSRIGSMAFIADMGPTDVRDTVSPNYKIFGPLVAAAKLWGLDRDAVERALSIGWATTPAFNPSFLSDAAFDLPNMLKNNYLACCETGIEVALLARHGFVGTRDLLDRDPMVMVSDLDFDGKIHLLELMQFKPWSTCRFIHGGIGLTLEIMAEEGIKPAEIERIVFRSFRWICSSPYENRRPAYWNDVTWSVPYGIALAALGYPPGPEWYDPKRLTDPEIHALADKVDLETLPEASKLFLERGGIIKPLTEVELRAKGKVFTKRREGYKGDPDRPMSPDEVREKFTRLALYAIPQRQAEEVIACCDKLERLDDVGRLGRLMGRG